LNIKPALLKTQYCTSTLEIASPFDHRNENHKVCFVLCFWACQYDSP